jgi:Tfp pilus assembly protein PilF
VRIEAARSLAGAPEQSLPMDRRARFRAVIDEYIAAQTYNFDRPEGHMNVGNLAAAPAMRKTAVAQYQQALAIDPLFIAAYVNLADVYRATGKEVDAQVILRQGLKADPRSAVLHHTVGLALTRQKARDMALQEFKTAVQLAPNDGRFAYVYAFALNDSGQQADALDVLKTALKASPYDRNLLQGLVYFSQQTGDLKRGEAICRRIA